MQSDCLLCAEYLGFLLFTKEKPVIIERGLKITDLAKLQAYPCPINSDTILR